MFYLLLGKCRAAFFVFRPGRKKCFLHLVNKGSSMKIVVQKPTFFRSWIDPPGASSGIYLSFLISAASLSLLFDETRVSGVVSPPRGEWKPAPLLPLARLLSLTVKARAELGSGA